MSCLPRRFLTLSLALVGTATAVLTTSPLRAADPVRPWPCADADLVRYTALRTSQPIVVDGRLDDLAWPHAPRSPRYVDLITGKPTLYHTDASILWDDEYLYFAIRVEEPLVKAKFTEVNSPIYEENDIEIFIAGRDAYYEFEVNALNTTYEVFFIWEDSWERGGFASAPEFERSRLRPFHGIAFQPHPRGPRLGNFSWFFPGKRTAVWVDGTLNDDRDRDRGWTVEVAFPWSGMKWLATDGRALPPREGDEWRVDLSRFNQWKEAPPAKDSGGWALSAHRVWDSHVPECFPYVRFTTNNVLARVP